jgi:hypothetical protein
LRASTGRVELGWIRQREHEMVIMPPRWPHLVYHLSDTAMLTWARLSPLTPGAMSSCIKYAEKNGREACERPVPLHALFQQAEINARDLGISTQDAQENLIALQLALDAKPPTQTAAAGSQGTSTQRERKRRAPSSHLPAARSIDPRQASASQVEAHSSLGRAVARSTKRARTR